MTIAFTYIRNHVNPPELIIASDSRLSGGERWDSCRKIYPLRRGDSAIVFTGEIERFFPIISQVMSFCDGHKKNYSRAEPLPDLFNKILLLANYLVKQISDLPKGLKFPTGNCTILLCGWNWSPKKGDSDCFIKEMKYHPRLGTFVPMRKKFDQKNDYKKHKIIVIGDCVPRFWSEYSQRASLLNVLDMEPLDIFQKIIDLPDMDTIGGVVQAVKIYKHLNTLPILISKSQCKYLYGRKLFNWEDVSMETSHYDLQ